MASIDPQTGQDVSAFQKTAPDGRSVFARIPRFLFRAARVANPAMQTVGRRDIARGIDALQAAWIPHVIQNLRQFSAPDPWTGNDAALWSLNWYTLEQNPRGRALQQAHIAAIIARSGLAEAARKKPADIETGIETGGRYHLLPRMLARRWRRGDIDDRALPALVHRLEPQLRRKDFTIRQKLLLIVFGYVFGVMGLVPLAGALWGWVKDVPDAYTWLGVLAAMCMMPAAAALGAQLLQRRHDRQVERMINVLLAQSPTPVNL